jgi:hypothetical protein
VAVGVLARQEHLAAEPLEELAAMVAHPQLQLHQQYLVGVAVAVVAQLVEVVALVAAVLVLQLLVA